MANLNKVSVIRDTLQQKQDILVEEVVSTTTVTAIAGKRYLLQTLTPVSVTLPDSPTTGDVVSVVAGNLRVDNMILRNGQKICGLNEDMQLDNPHFPLTLQFNSTNGWRMITL